MNINQLKMEIHDGQLVIVAGRIGFTCPACGEQVDITEEVSKARLNISTTLCHLFSNCRPVGWEWSNQGHGYVCADCGTALREARQAQFDRQDAAEAALCEKIEARKKL